MVKNITNLARLLNIAVTLARYDALFPLIQIGIAPWMLKTMGLIAWFFPKPHDLGTRQGQHLAAALTQLGPSFIKFGQSLATRSDLIGEEIAADLSALQDKLPPFSSAIARAAITHELGEPVETLYENFTDEPVAAASIAQVHFATTTEGAAVAVKVLRPGIEEAFAKDLALFAWIAEKVEQFRPDLRRLKPREVVKTFAGIVAIEMDLRLEAAAASELADNFAGDDTFKVPTIDWTRTGQRVLTLERINGIPIDERATLIQAGIDPEDVLQKAACAFFRQMFRDGFFHGDMHPGNLFVAPDGGLIAVDFGIMGRLDAPTRRYLGEMLLGFLDGDYARVADVHFRAGYIPADQPRDIFMQACRAIGEPILGLPMNEISLARLLGQMFAVTETFQMETQPQLLLLQKPMMVAEGVGRTLNPNVNIWELARPLIETWMAEQLGPEARITDVAQDAMGGIERLPRFVANVERLAEVIAEKVHNLHPDTLSRLLEGNFAAPQPSRLPLWIICALLAGILAALLKQ